MKEIDINALMDCPDHDCDGFLVRVHLPSQEPLFRCAICGKYFTKSVWNSTGTYDEVVTVCGEESK